MKKIFDGEKLIGTKPTILLQIFCKFCLSFKAIVKSIIEPNDYYLEELFTG